MLISICMIVKNEEENLPLTLPSMVAGSDEVIMVDTGSQDRTREIARELGATVYDFSWKSDFSAARNEGLKHARGKFVLWLDADEFVPLAEFKKLRKILERTTADLLFAALWECPRGKTCSENYYRRDKIFRNNKGFRFVRPVNEQLQTPEKFSRDEIDFNIYHWGGNLALTPEKKQQKKQRNIALLEKAIAQFPKDPFYHFLLGNNYMDLELRQKAVEVYEKVIELLPEGEIAIRARCQVARCLILQKKHAQALALAEEACRLDPRNPEPALVKASILIMSQNRFEEGIKTLLPIFSMPKDKGAEAVINLRNFDYYPSYLLGVANLKLGRKEEALSYLKQADQIMPNPKVQNPIRAFGDKNG
jgi:tetratricopeptide (TPR) repeat protein